VRNLREEAAVLAEQDLLRRALDADEQEALSLLDQIRRVEKQLEESEAALAEAQAELEPTRKELLEGREQARSALDDLMARRKAYASSVEAGPLRVYESIKAGGRGVVVAKLTGDGACGNCFSVIPLQVQNEIRSGAELIRCEGCGVILGDADEG
jgi:predicted  nucleic acid-binding Zn-ribbon protein